MVSLLRMTTYHKTEAFVQVVLAASICTRGGKAVLSRQFREIPRSRVEALLASFPKLADSGTQHTTVEQDNVRFVYQPLDELYMVLITNRQSNILQDIDSLHLFAQVVTSICKKLDEREISRNAFELLSAFDELVTLGYRENLSLSQIKTFLEMESHEERIQEIIARNKELEASEERKRKAKQLEMQRKEAARSAAFGRGVAPKVPQYPTYQPPSRPTVTDTYDSYESEKNKTFNKPLATRGKGMQLGKKTKTTDIYDKVKADFGPETEESAPLVSATTPVVESKAISSNRASLDGPQSPIHVTISESLSAKITRDGALKSYEVKGDLSLRITDPSFTKLALALTAEEGPLKAQFKAHPKVDKSLFNSQKAIQPSDANKRFPANNNINVLRWRAAAPADSADVLPITFSVWVNPSDDSYTITIEYELSQSIHVGPLKNVVVTIPYTSSEPSVSSFDATYEVTGEALEWTIGTVDSANPNGSFEFEAQADADGEFFPMAVKFEMSKPLIDVDLLNATLIEEGEEVDVVKVIRSASDGFAIE